MNKFLKCLVQLLLLFLCIIVFLTVSFYNFVYFLRYADIYTLKSEFDEQYVRDALSNEMRIDIPEDAKIEEVNFQRVWDASEYKVTYIDKNNIKVSKENYRDADGIQLDQYMKENASSNTNRVKGIFILLELIECYIIFICFCKLRKKINNR